MSTTLASSAGGGDGEARVFHVMRVGGITAAERPEKRKDVLIHDLEHFLGLEMFEARPAQVIVWPAFAVFADQEYLALNRLLQARGFVLLQGMEITQPFQEKEIGNLLDDFERVGDAARPESIPERVDFAADFTGKHETEFLQLLN